MHVILFSFLQVLYYNFDYYRGKIFSLIYNRVV